MNEGPVRRLFMKTDLVWSRNSSCPLPHARTSHQAKVHDKSGSVQDHSMVFTEFCPPVLLDRASPLKIQIDAR
jgi:hypothetical protein